MKPASRLDIELPAFCWACCTYRDPEALPLISKYNFLYQKEHSDVGSLTHSWTLQYVNTGNFQFFLYFPFPVMI